ncbi:peptidase [Parazoarcus communis]|uniref:Probable periplasmic serine endoprotease DegP-like n=1 Tax=Parazoarcus communis TaxID=41977 RepID=A0A2U8GLJ4_9RHOO|nr:DegQ family serine endoprotease [Parazoarcus communis]AWI74338.1 peptidase [Parazoarcus communis]
MKTKVIQLSGVAVAVAALAIGGYNFANHSVGSAHAAPASIVASASSSSSPPATLTLPDFQSIAERYGPAVVNISVEGTVKTSARGQSPFEGMSPNDPFYEFFRRFGPQIQIPDGEQITHGMGSGFIVSADGVILTNAHVVADATQVTVKLMDKREFTAKVIGIDRPTDIAVLRIDARDLPTVPLGDPSQTRVGEWVLAIGAPFGFENSVTAGIVSAKSRSLPDEGYVPFIQTDVAINPGNSGGPLLNLKGEVIGINSQIYSRSGGYQGLSFAIPINVAAQVRDQLVTHGKVTRGRLGVSVQDLNQALANSFGLETAHGALVSRVDTDGPAAKAGIEPGDIIIGLNGERVESSAELPPKVAAIAPGESVKVEIWRQGKRRELTATVGELMSAQLAATDGQNTDQGRLGVAVRPLSPEEQKQIETSSGLLVLDSTGPAAHAGIQRGDVILAVNGKPVISVEGLRKDLAALGKHAAILIQREDARIFIPIELG